MSFFSRRPNPPVPPAASKQLAIAGAQTTQANRAPAGRAPSPVAPQNATGEQQQAPSNARFRSFAERYVVERCRDWKEGEIDERAWATILEAKSIYNKVKEVGRTLNNDN